MDDLHARTRLPGTPRQNLPNHVAANTNSGVDKSQSSVRARLWGSADPTLSQVVHSWRALANHDTICLLSTHCLQIFDACPTKASGPDAAQNTTVSSQRLHPIPTRCPTKYDCSSHPRDLKPFFAGPAGPPQPCRRAFFRPAICPFPPFRPKRRAGETRLDDTN